MSLVPSGKTVGEDREREGGGKEKGMGGGRREKEWGGKEEQGVIVVVVGRGERKAGRMEKGKKGKWVGKGEGEGRRFLRSAATCFECASSIAMHGNFCFLYAASGKDSGCHN